MSERFADQWFDKIAGKKGATEVATTGIDRDIKRVRRETKQVKRLVNKLIAHTERDRRRVGKHRYGNLNMAINALWSVFKKYALLIDGGALPAPLDDFDLSEDFSKLWP